MTAPPSFVRHASVRLALHRLSGGVDPAARPLLLLHGLGERTPDRPPAIVGGWPGPVWGLDFTGHGRSSLARAGGYTAEILLADADVALASLGTAATVLGRGLGAYVALLLAGARPALVRGAVLADGPGLVGGGPRPTSPSVLAVPAGPRSAPDPWALLELSSDIRPPDYATSFARMATQASELAAPITVASVIRPDWLAAVVAEPGVQEASLPDALAAYATLP